MADAETMSSPTLRLGDLVERLQHTDGFAQVTASLRAGHGATLDGVWGSSCALAVAALAQSAPSTLVVVCPHPDDVDSFLDDLALFAAIGHEPFPAWESLPDEKAIQDEIFGQRLGLLKRLAGGTAPRVVATSIQSLLQPVPSRESVSSQSMVLAVGEESQPEQVAAWLVAQKFHSTGAVQLPGEFSLRGGILDVFAPDWDAPARLEFFGEQIESIRRFDPESQRSLDRLESVQITAIDPAGRQTDHLASYLPPDAWFLLVEPTLLEEEGRRYLDRMERPHGLHELADVMRQVYRFPSITASRVASTTFETACHLKIESVERFSGDIARVRQELDGAGQGQQVFVVCQTEAEIERMAEIFRDTQLSREGRLHFPVGRLAAGFRLVNDRVVLVSANELFRRTDLHRPARRHLGRVIDSFLELREGDYVVHLSHGIGRYRGMRLLEKEGQAEEHLEIEFHAGTKIYVPASKIDLVQKYVGGSKSRPQLARIGARSWIRQRHAAETAVMDLASDMLELQAARATRPGIGFALDTDWQREFSAAFPYTETPDQRTAVEAICGDMRAPRPMDRLICGDVGYGKTELAMRAAFTAVDSGYQVAVLVPTTLLADQHGRTFHARMAEYPFEIAVLSRFCTGAEQRRILAGLADGSIDVVIGTHRLAQADVEFANLGLVVIDEEQRFGVAVKERLKTLRQIVDCMTMTATPIPRTLHMSLLGLRDISNLETPPADRLAVETRVARFDEDLIRHAVIRELSRDGQIFFVHNRVHDIGAVASRLQRIVPEARIGIGHGQMPEGELEDVMLDFIAHRFDILLATTIVESGLDIPNANTIFIDQADQYGLADLHQLRGRVGRYKHRAYCCLLIDPDKPLTPNAAKRLAAIEEFSNMGAGFTIAMRDLEIRGAGNILGAQQSGHISAVGYELYCELLEKAVAKLKNLAPRVTIDVNLDLPGTALLPRSYVPDMRSKIDLYRRLARLTSRGELREYESELTDRFGPPPDEVERLLKLAELRMLAHHWGIHSIGREPGYLVFGYGDRRRIEQLAVRSRGALRVVDAVSAYLPIPKDLTSHEAFVAVLESLLQVE